MIRDAPWLDRTQWPWLPRACPTADGTLHYVDEGDGPTIVLVHGTPTWAFEWRHVIAGLRETRRVVALDHLGFGLSERPDGADYRPEAHAARFASFMDHAAAAGAVSLVVHDFGGPIALAWALAHPERVRRLTVINSWMWSFGDDPVMRRRAAIVDSAIGRFLYRHANASQRLIMPSAYADKRRLTRDIHRQYLEVFPDADSRERVLFALARALRGSSGYYAGLWAQRDRLQSVPMSLIWGMRDSAFGPAILERWIEALPHAHVTRIDDAGHWPHEERPDLVLAALKAAV